MYQYRWLDAALDLLAALYVAADRTDRDRITAGVVAFNARLAADPLAVGESRIGDYRVAFPPLLRVYFRVDVAARRVWVTDVIRYGS